jgi:pimeloyl-ACP methyl ester carboxylesterase
MNENLDVEGIGSVDLIFTERGKGHAVLLLHGGAGPTSVVPWADLLARTRPARVITPTHPGFGGTPRPEALATVGGLARVYAAFIEKLGLEGVTIIGNSVGGWIAAELGLLAGARISSLALVNATGIEVPGHPVADVFQLSPDELSRLSYHDPARFRIDPSKLAPEQKAMMVANLRVLKLYGGPGAADPSLRARLSASALPPTLVAWGESDRIVDPEYGRAYAQAIRGAAFRLIEGAGHVPQIETPELLADTIWPFVVEHAPGGAGG